MRGVGRRLGWAAAICLGLVGGACTAAASSPGSGTTARGHRHGASHSTPRRDTFKGSIVSGTGAYDGDTGRVTIYLHPHGSGGSRHVRVVVRGSPCHGASSCLDLNGHLSGKLSRSGHPVPDVGSHYTLKATGRLTPLGHVAADGWAHGTGFINQGHEQMRLTLTNSKGTITVRARSPQVRGFSSP